MSGLPAAAAVGAVGYGGYKAATNRKYGKNWRWIKNAGEFLSPSEIAKLPPKEAAKVMQQQKQQLLLAAPDKMSAIPMSERDIACLLQKYRKQKFQKLQRLLNKTITRPIATKITSCSKSYGSVA